MNLWSFFTFLFGVIAEILVSYIFNINSTITVIILVISIIVLGLCIPLHKRFPRFFGEKCSFAVIAIIFDETFSKVILVYNKRQKKKIPPGGHAKSEKKLHEFVKEKVKEETGIECDFILNKFHDYEDRICISVPQPFAVQIEIQTDDEGHDEHYDFIYLMKADSSQALTQSHQANWYSVDEIEEMADRRATYQDVYKMINSAKEFLINQLDIEQNSTLD